MSVDQPIASPPPSLFAGVEPLEVFVELLAEIDMHTAPTEFYDRICEAICRLTTMRRAAVFMADTARRRVRAIGSHGIPFEQLSGLRPTLVNTPIAQRALLEDKVVVISEGIEEAVPPAYAQLLGVTTLVCTPMSAGGYAYGVICADRGGGRFELSDGERHLLWTLGKTAALVAAARNVTRQQERMRRLGDRLDLAREIHESVLQRLFGVSLVLGAEQPLDRDERERCRIEMQEALSRSAPRARAPAGAARRPRLGPRWRPSSTACASRPGWWSRSTGMARRACRPMSSRSPSRCWPRRCATSPSTPIPTRIEVAVARDEEDVRARGSQRRRCGRALAIRAWGCGWRSSRRSSRAATVESGPVDGDRWRVRLVVPLQQDFE